MAGTLIKTIALMDSAVKQLQLDMPLSDVERIGIMVNKAMSTQARSFHTADHIFSLVKPGKPLQNLAALFHDIVYYSIDLGFIPEIEAILSDYVTITDGVVSIRSDIDMENSCSRGVLAAFGFMPGDELSPFGGLNEVLSAFVMSHELEDYLSRPQMLEAICYIEATIPFRGANADGIWPAEALFQRVVDINTKYGLELSDDHMVEIIQQSVEFANSDVENFAEEEVGAFLDNTWKLLPETNPSLRFTGLYTTHNYRVALQKMEGFMSFLDSQKIFGSFRGIPEENRLAGLRERALRNVIAAREYLGIKLFTTGVLEAIAECTGGDVPIALLMGDISDSESINRFEGMLPVPEGDTSSTEDSEVYRLLTDGRSEASNFDLNRSPLSRYLYLGLGPEKVVELLVVLKKMFTGDLTPLDFLKTVPRLVLIPVLTAIGDMAFTRTERLSELSNTL